MFSPKRSTDRKDDRKAKRERFRRMYDSRDNNNIKLNLLGVPKEQVSIKKSQEESKNENLFKIYINTRSNEDKKDKTKALGVPDTTRSEPARRAGMKNDVCLTLPGEKKREIKIIQRPSEKFFQEALKQPEDHAGTNVQNIRHDRTVESRPRKHRPKKQVGFSDYDAVYGTGSEQSLSSDDDMPFDKTSPIVYQVEGIKPESGFGGTGFSSDLKTIYLDKNSVTRPPGGYEALESFEESKPKQLHITPSPSPTIKQFENLSMDDNFSPQSYQKIKQQPSRNDSIKESLLNVVGERNPETQTPNVTKPMMVDREVMTDRPSVNKGNISNIGSGLSKPWPVSKHSSKESTDSNQSSDQTKPRKSLVSSIPKPDFGMFRRSKSSKSAAEHVNGPETQSKTSQENNEKDPKFLHKETGLNMTSKTPRKLTPIPIKNRNYKPIFFPLEAKEDVENHLRPTKPSSTNLTGESFENKAVNVSNADKQTSMDPNVNGKVQAKDKMRFTDPQEKVSLGKHEKISNNKYPSTATTNELNDNKNRPSNLISTLPSSEIVTNDHLIKEIHSRPGKVEKQTSLDSGFEKLDDETPSTVNTMRTQQEKVSAEKSNEISSITYPSTSISKDPNQSKPSSPKPVDDIVEISPKFNLNEERPLTVNTSSSNNYENPLQLGSVAGENRPTAQDRRHERRPVDDIMTRSLKKQYNEPNLPELGGYVGLNAQEPSYGLPTSKDTAHGATVETKPGMTTTHSSRSTLSSTYTTGTLDSSRPHLDQESKGEQKKLELTPSPFTEQLASLLMVDRRVNPQKDRKLTNKPFLNEVEESPSISEPETSLQVKDTQSDVKETDSLSLLSGLHPNDYVSRGAIPRTTSTVKSTIGSLSSAQLVLPSVGERLSKRGSPFIETIQEEDTDDTDSPRGGPDYKTNQATEQHGNLKLGNSSNNNYGVDSNDVFIDGHDKIDKDRTNIMAFSGHLVDNTPFAYSPSGPEAHPLDPAHPEDTIQEQAAPDPNNDIHKPSRTSKVGRKRAGPGKKRRKSSLIRDRGVDDLADQKENGNGVFGQGLQHELIYLGKIPNTTYNVFYAPDEVKTPENMESKTVVPIRSQKMISEGPKGILIFVNKKNDHKCPFKTNGYGDQTTNSDENKGMKSNRNDASLTDYKGVKPNESSAESSRGRDPNKEKKVTVKRTSNGKIVTEDFPCGCYRTARFDKADVLQTEEFISGLCKDASTCEVAHPELAKNKETAYRPGKETRVHERQKKHPKYDHGDRFPGLEIIAKGLVSKEPIKPRPPGQTMNGANLLASFNIKSNKLKGVCNLYFDDSLKRYLRENLTTILETDDKTRQKRLSN